MHLDGLATDCGQVPEWVVSDAPPTGSRVARKGPSNWLSDLLVFTKARVNCFVVGTAFVGFALEAQILPNWRLLLCALLGTGCFAGAAAAANQILEQKFDQDMIRTWNRPLAAGRIHRKTAVALAIALLCVGCLCLGGFVSFRALILASVTFLIYVFVYTPLKRRTPFCILVGAVAGALPLLIGWAASGAAFDLWAGIAFAVLFLWQIPHFLAIAWRWKSDYLRAGYCVLPLDDTSGYRTAGWALAGAVATVAISLIPVVLRQVGSWYLLAVFAIGAAMIFASALFLMRRTEAAARSLFIVSLLYLPCLNFLMLVCRTHM